MTARIIACIFCLAVLVSVQAAPKPDELQVTSMKVKREGDLILVDTTIRNATGKPMQRVVAIYKFYSPSHEVMSTHRSAIDETVLEPGAEAEIHAQLAAPPKAVSAEFGAERNGGRELRVGNAGPFTIE